jgi:hypothetical protein
VAQKGNMSAWEGPRHQKIQKYSQNQSCREKITESGCPIHFAISALVVAQNTKYSAKRGDK